MLTLAEHALIRKDFLEIWSSKMARATLIAVPNGERPLAGMPSHPPPCNAGTRRRILGKFPFTPPSAVHPYRDVCRRDHSSPGSLQARYRFTLRIIGLFFH